MPTKLISMKVPIDVLERIRADALAQRTTVTALLLRPWLGGETVEATPVPALPRSGGFTVVTAPKRSRTTVVQSKGRVIGYATDGSEIRR